MFTDLQPYPEYKPSGQDWLGKVPAGWSVKPNRAIFSEVNDRNHPNEEMLSVTITRGIVPQKALLADTSKKDGSKLDKSAYKLVCPGDIAYNKMRAWQGAIAESAHRGIISPAYIVMRPRSNQNSRYFHYLFRTPYFAKEAERWSYGITSDMWSLRPEHFRIIYSVQPPPDEQGAIVRLLDHANRKVEKLIHAKRKLIALLNEQKQAIIHRAVTRGLDISVPLKPSGISWLGDIPKHWTVRRLGSAIELITGFPFKSTGFTQNESGTRLLRGINVTPTGLRWDTVVRWQRVHGDSLDSFSLVVGDIVLGLDRPVIASGVRAARVKECDVPSLLLQRVARLRPNQDLDTDFLLSLLGGKPFKDYITPIFTGISVPHLSSEQVRGFNIALPPKAEQMEIMRFVEDETTGLDATIAKTAREIFLMQEYRTRFTADVVTGKLDVRRAAAELPEIEKQFEADEVSEEDEPDLEEAVE